jgi:C-terminal processing protease CtpA/Prc
VQRTIEIVEAHYLFPEMAEQLADRLRSRRDAGVYSEIDSVPRLVETLNADLHSVSGDRHLRLDLGRDVAVTKERMKLRRERLEETNHGFNKGVRFPGNVGYLELIEFCPPDAAGEAMREAFEALEGSATLILDLRRNEGGAGDLIPRICERLFPERTRLYDIVDPRSDESEVVFTTEEAASGTMAAIPIYVLTSGTTFSSAECLAYTLQTLRGAIVVGERTAGGAHPTRSFVIREAEVVVTVPVRDMLNPVTGTNWEGTGVVPDLEVSAEQALQAALEHAMARLKVEERN